MYVTLTKKSISVILATVIISLILIGQILTINAGGIDASTNEKRLHYLNSLGLLVEETATDIKTVIIPQKFSNVYIKYNLLQQKSGFNLSNYRGKEVKIYTYTLKEEPKTQVHLMVHKDNVIGGDIASLQIDGKMTELKGKNE